MGRYSGEYCHIFDYPVNIRKAIYSTSAEKSFNSEIYRIVKNAIVFPIDESGFNVTQLKIKGY
ncbi:transposase [Aggregatibacter actinomycetemcomitans]|nr:transposase [Aggregatibacter actinomycetemcomitans]